MSEEKVDTKMNYDGMRGLAKGLIKYIDLLELQGISPTKDLCSSDGTVLESRRLSFIDLAAFYIEQLVKQKEKALQETQRDGAGK